MGGYADIGFWYNQTMRSESTHHQSYGTMSPPSLYKAFLRLADGYPDPKTGQNTALSSALRATFTQVFVLHPKDMPLAAAQQQHFAATAKKPAQATSQAAAQDVKQAAGQR
jgi:hypothetical protein